jgi:hypothetical protein
MLDGGAVVVKVATYSQRAGVPNDFASAKGAMPGDD